MMSGCANTVVSNGIAMGQLRVVDRVTGHIRSNFRKLVTEKTHLCRLDSFVRVDVSDYAVGIDDCRWRDTADTSHAISLLYTPLSEASNKTDSTFSPVVVHCSNGEDLI